MDRLQSELPLVRTLVCPASLPLRHHMRLPLRMGEEEHRILLHRVKRFGHQRSIRGRDHVANPGSGQTGIYSHLHGCRQRKCRAVGSASVQTGDPPEFSMAVFTYRAQYNLSIDSSRMRGSSSDMSSRFSMKSDRHGMKAPPGDVRLHHPAIGRGALKRGFLSPQIPSRPATRIRERPGLLRSAIARSLRSR